MNPRAKRSPRSGIAASLVSFQPGEVIFNEGDPGDEMYILLKGDVRIFQGAGEDRREIRILQPGGFFGEMAILSDSPRSAAAVAGSETLLARIKKSELHDLINARPEIALHITRTLIAMLKEQQAILASPANHSEAAQLMSWRPVLRKEKIKISLVSLSTCAGCSAVLLDDQLLEKLFQYTKIVYCPMLMDNAHLSEADVAIVDGLVRLRDDVQVLEEARAKSRYLVAWGTCAAYGGIPGEANRFEPEELIAETYGNTVDAFSYYLSGQAGVDRDATYQKHGKVALLRQAHRISTFAKVDYFLPGCPANPELLLQLITELMTEQAGKGKAIVCAECTRKASKDVAGSFHMSPIAGADPGKCLTSLGAACMGFVTKGGCGAPCPINGMPCWGCRGPSMPVVKKIAAGDYYEEVFSKGLSLRCKVEEAPTRERVRVLKRQGHALFDFDHEASASATRYR